ncbi:hypothetical protein AAE02nite_30980 [Adhaeribacter aerolatus]|uniref:STAS/SEC14 domain-containing protein n=1 Tax=Adhaeribacter aerolatus TaxID=670289 RepID=A0A512B0E9_9BACT|nr:hypothetical protein [Adhaeribacter aerolatus]GEO05434.1 hypothetical protein AAE02nite_30980 [Adhaeribacter aerolatus]
MATLSLKPLYEDEAFQIRVDKAFAVLELTFLKNPDKEHFRNGYRLAFDAAASKNINYWLTDATQIKAMERENQVWLLERMTPLLKANIIRCIAIVMAPECFVMTNPNQVYEKKESDTSSAGQIKVHFDKEAAYDWLFSSIKATVV